MDKKELTKHTDERGVIMFVSPQLLDFNYQYQTIGTINPGGKRGGHWHKLLHKKMLCVSGLIAYTLKHKYTKDDASRPIPRGLLFPGQVLDVPPYYIVNFFNEEKEVAVFIEFKDREHDENDRYQT